jgi:integrase/recombinase XerC
VWMIETRSAATALSKHKALQQFFVWLSAEEQLEHSPMEWIPEPLLVTDVDLDADTVHLHGKGAKERRVRLGPKRAASLSRYLRVRSKHRGSENLVELWLALRGAKPLRPNGIKVRLKRLGEVAGIGRVYAHRWRHNFAHE